MNKYLFLFFFLAIPFSFSKEVPNLTGPVIDQASILKGSSKIEIGQVLKQFKAQTGIQLQLLIIDSLEDEYLEGYSIKVVDKWKLGSKKEDNGVLFLISIKDKKMRLEVGQGLEGTLTDALSGRILDSVRSLFRKGEFEKGIYQGLIYTMKVLNKEEVQIARQKKRRKKRFSFFHIIFVLFMLFSFFMGGGRRRRSSILYGGSSWGGGSNSSWSGGGSSWGGGGGGFSGGGASSSW